MIQLLTTTLMLFGISESTKNSFENCISPKAECDLNTCLPLSLCPALISKLGNITVDSTADEIPEKYLCKAYGKNYPCACCPIQEEENFPPLAYSPTEADKSYLIPPAFECCDRPVLFAYGGKSISYGEFPSLALLHYVNSNGMSSFPCAGTLISKNYVLTAAHCVTGKILEKAGKLSKIRLGEYDLSDTECVDGKCNDGSLEFEIEKIIFHEEYDDNLKPHDIALIRLAKPMEHFRIHISPICLRWVHNTPSPVIESNHTFTVVGWGRTLSVKQSKIGNKVSLPHYDLNQCAERYKIHKTNITERQICAGGEFKIDACDGDSGGPLISKIGDCNYLDGIVSFGRGCGLENWPGVYTNVTAYRDWIMQNIEP